MEKKVGITVWYVKQFQLITNDLIRQNEPFSVEYQSLMGEHCFTIYMSEQVSSKVKEIMSKYRVLKYFTINELELSKKALQMKWDNSLPMSLMENAINLVVNVLDPLREKYGKPIFVNSGYRCPLLNNAVGGVPTSQHLLAQAADITTHSTKGNEEILNIIKQELEYDQVIKYDTFIHVSFNKKNNRKQALIGKHKK
jgi:zinc D-Ala-D-Ala carboxypeptidase